MVQYAGVKADLVASEIDDVLNSNKFERKVKQDEMSAAQLGVQGVPFFVINNKYAINGVQHWTQYLINDARK